MLRWALGITLTHAALLCLLAWLQPGFTQGGPLTPPFPRFPADLADPDDRVVGGAGLHPVLKGWRNIAKVGSANPRGETASVA
jgi:hypothetical protein